MLPLRYCFIVLACCAGCMRSEPRVVLYCAQDRDFAVPLFEDFRVQTGLPIVPKYDTEKNKSVSLYEELVAEKNRPRCDLFLNNEILCTIRLQK